MIRLPDRIELTVEGTTLRFNIISIQDGVYAITDPDLHLLQNEDQRTFGYIIWKDEYLYGYRVTPSETENDKNHYCLIHMAYCGPDGEIDDDTLYHLVCEIGNTFVRHSKFQVRNPSLVIADRLDAMGKRLVDDADKFGDMQTPYMETVRGLAIQLRDYYTKMVDRLSEAR